MKQIVDKLNKIARAVDNNVTLPSRKLIIDSLDAITTAFKGTIVNSHLIVDKLDAIAWAVGQYDGGGSDVPCFDYKEVNVYIEDRISATDQDSSGAFSVDLLPLGCVLPSQGRHIEAPPEITYEYTGEEIIDNPTTILWCVNYYDPRPLRQPYYQFKILINPDYTSGWIAIDVNGLNCDVNVVNGFIEVTIPESQEEEVGIVIVIRSGLR